MKRLLLTFLALVAMTAGAWAQTDYGFRIKGIGINSSNYQSLSSGEAWYYDPVANVLHLTEGQLYCNETEMILIYENVNPSLNISVDGNCEMEGIYNNAIGFIGEGEGYHTIYGSGTLSMESQKINPTMLWSHGGTHLTIKDITLNIRAYGDASRGIESLNFASITFDNCEANIITSHAAYWSTDAHTGASPTFIKCFLWNAFPGTQFTDYINGEYVLLKEAHIKRTINSVSVSIEAPQIGNTPSSNVVTDSEDYYATIVEWYHDYSSQYSYRMPDDETYAEGNIYRVEIILKPTEGNRFWNKIDEVTAYVNGHPATVYSGNGDYLTIRYTFPALSDTYDLWIAGIQVTKQNKDNLAELVAELSNEALERYFEGDMEITYDNASQTLTLKNAIIYAATGYGIQSKLSSPKIKLIGDNTITADNGMGVRIQPGTGASDGAIIYGGGSLDIKASGVGLRSHLNLFLTDGVKITSEGDAIGFQGWKVVSSDDPLPTLTMTGPETMLRTKGTREGSFANYGQLNLQDDIRIMQPSGATFVPNIGIVNNNQLVTDEWVVIGKPARGDVNLDGTVDIADVTAVLTAMANGSHDPQYRVNDDEVVDIADVTAILTIMAGQ